MSHADKYKLFSITDAAREMHLGKDNLYRLISEGKIGTIKIGKREKIPASEIGRFQSENVVMQPTEKPNKTIPIRETTKSKSKSLFRALREEILNGECL